MHRLACTWVEDSGAKAGELSWQAHGEAHVGQVDWVNGREELNYLVDPI